MPGKNRRSHREKPSTPSPSLFMEYEAVLQSRMGPQDWKTLVTRADMRLRNLGQDLERHDVVTSPSLTDSQGSTAVTLTGKMRSFNPALLPSRSYMEQPRLAVPLSSDAVTGARTQTPHTLPLNAQEKAGTHPLSARDMSREMFGIQLDAWQCEALDLLMQGKSIVVDAPTSAGKTRVIEALIASKKSEGGLRLLYTTPVKSLSNDKYREFCEMYGKENVGINTGDFKENLQAPLVIGTLETYRNSLLGLERPLDRHVIVYDEYHYLQDPSRGSAWEESIILTPSTCQLVLLSASVPNAQAFAHWIGQLKGKDCVVVKVTKRPVPLVDLVLTKAGLVFADDLKLRPDEIRQMKRAHQRVQRADRRPPKMRSADVLASVAAAVKAGLWPLVIYAGRRGDTEALASGAVKALAQGLSDELKSLIAARVKDLSGWDYVPGDLKRLIQNHGIAFHHSGLIPPARVAIESLLKEGLLRICTGTMGISLGVNFAVRSAVISDETRPSEGGDVTYSGSEVLQMLGRAGRRGKDKQGFALWQSLGRYAQQRPKEREDCQSSLRFSPVTLLGLLGQGRSFAELSDFYLKSFFMLGKDPQMVYLEDHEFLSAQLYRKGMVSLPCQDIPKAFAAYLNPKTKRTSHCGPCSYRSKCHNIVQKSRQSPLGRVLRHLQHIQAINGCELTQFGQWARYFPQSGGLIFAHWLATQEVNAQNLEERLPTMAIFSSNYFKEIPWEYGNKDLVESLKIPEWLEKMYPAALFPDLYDEPDRGPFAGEVVFREFNPAASSVVAHWLQPRTTWSDLVESHATQHVSAGDCMNVLLRFATVLQSLSRLGDFLPELSSKSKDILKYYMREPLSADWAG